VTYVLQASQKYRINQRFSFKKTTKNNKNRKHDLLILIADITDHIVHIESNH